MKNKLTDLNDHLFEQLERLTDPNISPEQVESEIRRSSAVVSLADKIVQNARLQLDACELVAEYGDRVKVPMLSAGTASGGDK